MLHIAAQRITISSRINSVRLGYRHSSGIHYDKLT